MAFSLLRPRKTARQRQLETNMTGTLDSISAREPVINPNAAANASRYSQSERPAPISPEERRKVNPILERLPLAAEQTNSMDEFDMARNKMRREGVRGAVIGPRSMQQPYQSPSSPLMRPSAQTDQPFGSQMAEYQARNAADKYQDPNIPTGAEAGPRSNTPTPLMRPSAQSPERAVGQIVKADPGILTEGLQGRASGEGLANLFPKTYGQDRDESGTPRLARTDARAGFDSPMLRNRVAGRESQERQAGLITQRQGHEIELANIAQQTAVGAASTAQKNALELQSAKDAGALELQEKKPQPLLMGREKITSEEKKGLNTKKGSSDFPLIYDPVTGKQIDTTTPEQKLQTGIDAVDQLGATLQATGKFGGYVGNNKSGKEADANVDKAVKDLMKTSFPDIPVNSQALKLMREGLRNGESAADLIAEMQDAISQSL